MSKKQSKKKEPRLDWLDRSLLTSPYHYALCLNKKAFVRELKILKVPKSLRPPFLKNSHSHATVDFFEETADSGLCCIVRMHPREKGVSLTQVYGLLVHEAVHIWQACRDHIGEAHPAHEEEAYAIQRIAQSLMHSYRVQTRTKKGKKK